MIHGKSCAYIVLVRIKIGCPKNAGTFSSMSECVLMKFNVASGNVRESLWHDPGLGSGTYVNKSETKIKRFSLIEWFPM